MPFLQHEEVDLMGAGPALAGQVWAGFGCSRPFQLSLPYNSSSGTPFGQKMDETGPQMGFQGVHPSQGNGCVLRGYLKKMD